MAKSIAVRAQRPVDEPADEIAPDLPAVGDASLTSSAAYPHAPNPHVPNIDPESSARILTPPAPAPPPLVPPKPVYRPQPELVTMPSRPHPRDFAPAAEEAPRYASRNWRAEAWERERERELRAIENRPGIAARRCSNA